MVRYKALTCRNPFFVTENETDRPSFELVRIAYLQRLDWGFGLESK